MSTTLLRPAYLVARAQAYRVLTPALALPVAKFATSAADMSNISDAIKHDHRELEEYYNNILSATSLDEKARWQNQFTWELARHSVGEEIVVYPALEKHVLGGKEMAERDRAEHRKVKVLLKQFQDMDPSDSKFESTIKTLYSDLAAHIKEEERDDLPKLEEALSRDDSIGLASEFRLTKKFVPTRSHPSAPDKPPFETAMGLLAAPIDKLGDMLRRFPKH